MALLRVQGQLGRPALRLPRWRLGIRARLFLLALVTLSPLVGVLAFQDYFHLVAARQRADADAARLAIMKAGDVDQHLLAVETQLAALRAIVSTQPDQVSTNVAALTAMLPDLPPYIDGIAAYTSSSQRLGGAWRDDLGRQIPERVLQDAVPDASASASRRLIVGSR